MVETACTLAVAEIQGLVVAAEEELLLQRLRFGIEFGEVEDLTKFAMPQAVAKSDQSLVVAAAAGVVEAEEVYPHSLMVELPYPAEEELQWRLPWGQAEAEEVILRRCRLQ